MSETISNIAIQEKNKLDSDSIFFIALEISVPSLVETIKVVDIDDNITWRGETWQAFPLSVEEIKDKAGEAPKTTIKVSNISGAFSRYIAQYDTYCKVNGYSPINVKLYILNSLNLASDTPEVEYNFTLEKPSMDSLWVTLELGVGNIYRRRCPCDRILKNQCRFKFKDNYCRYTGSKTTCNKTLTRCRELNNSRNFGGFPGVGRNITIA